MVADLHAIPDWTVPYLAYMTRGELPEDETLARQITRRSKSMTIVNGELHRCSVTGAFQRCVSPEEGREVDAVTGHFKGYQVEHIDRRKNKAADALSWLGSQRKPVPTNTFLDVLHNPSLKLPAEEDLAVPDPEAQLVAALHVIPDWTVPYLAYMTRGELSEDETLARQITRRSKSMTNFQW